MHMHMHMCMYMCMCMHMCMCMLAAGHLLPHHRPNKPTRTGAQVLNKRWLGPGWQPWGSQGNSSWGPGNRDPSTRLESAQSRTIEELTHAAVPRIKDEWDGDRKRAVRRRAQEQALER